MSDFGNEAPLICVCLKPSWRVDIPIRMTPHASHFYRDGRHSVLSQADRECITFAFAFKSAWEQAYLPHQNSRVTDSTRVSIWGCMVSADAADEALLRDAKACGMERVFRVTHNLEESLDRNLLPSHGSASYTQFKAQLLSYALQRQLRSTRALLVLCGVKSIDEGHEAFGAYLAHALGTAFAHRVLSIVPDLDAFRAQVALPRGYSQHLTLKLPAVISVEPQWRTHAYPSWQNRLNATTTAVECEHDAQLFQESSEHTTLRLAVPRVKKHPPVDTTNPNPTQRMLALLSEGEHAEGICLQGPDVDTHIAELLSFLERQNVI